MSRTPKGQTRRRVYAFVRRELLAGRAPSLQEIQRALELRAVEPVRRHLDLLVREGKLAKRAGARGYRLPGAARAGARLVPLVGEVQAGVLAEAIEDPEGHIVLSPEPASGEYFALRVRGESMTGAGILPGDVAVVRRQPTAQSGDIVVALVGNEATVKRLRLRRGRVELHAENPEFSPIIPKPDEVALLGKVVEVRRRYEADFLSADDA
ncbi:MAG: transcriptional repressor LexA [Deltaproteobacteria bacterium]|nr:transcriptional repressor LexA [Deltaproteobacteria bacterium]